MKNQGLIPESNSIIILLAQLKKDVSYFCEIYTSNSSQLDVINPKKLLMRTASYIPKAESQEELAFYIFAVNNFLNRIKDASFDGLEIQKDIKQLSKNLHSHLSSQQTYIDFRAENKEIIENFIRKSNEFLKNLSTMDEKSMMPVKQKVKKLISKAEKLDQILLSPEKREVVLTSFSQKLKEFEVLAESHPEKSKAKSSAINACRQTLIKLFNFRCGSLESLKTTYNDPMALVALGLGVSGPLGEINRALEIGIAITDLVISLSSAGKDISDHGVRENLGNIGLTTCSLISLITIMVAVPPSIPVILTVIGVLDISKDLKKLCLNYFRVKRVEARCLERLEAVAEIESILDQAIRADLEERLEQSVELGLLKSKIIYDNEDESKLKVYQKELNKVSKKQIFEISNHLVYGKTYNLDSNALREIKILSKNLDKETGLDGRIFAEKLIKKNQSPAQAKIIAPVLAALCRDYSSRGEVAEILLKLLDTTYQERGEKLKKMFGREFSQEHIENFIKLFSDCQVAGNTFTLSLQRSLQ